MTSTVGSWTCGQRAVQRIETNMGILVVAAVTWVFLTACAQGQSYHEILVHSFNSGTDGSNPMAPLVLDAAGNLYGTTYGGGVNGTGTVFRIDSTGNESVLYSFMAGADGQYPSAGLILAGSKLYGTTQAGGTSGYGTVFEVSIAGQESILYSLRGGTDGAYPSGGLVLVGRNRPRFEVMLMPLTGPSAIDWVDKDSAKCSGCSARRPLVAQISGEPLWHYPTNFFPTFSFAVRESTDRCRIYE